MPKIIPAIHPTEPAYNIDEACAFLGGVTRQTLYNYTRKKKIKSYRIGVRIYYLESELKAFTMPPAPPPKPDLRIGKTSAATLAKLRSQGFKV